MSHKHKKKQPTREELIAAAETHSDVIDIEKTYGRLSIDEMTGIIRSFINKFNTTDGHGNQTKTSRKTIERTVALTQDRILQSLTTKSGQQRKRLGKNTDPKLLIACAIANVIMETDKTPLYTCIIQQIKSEMPSRKKADEKIEELAEAALNRAEKCEKFSTKWDQWIQAALSCSEELSTGQRAIQRRCSKK